MFADFRCRRIVALLHALFDPIYLIGIMNLLASGLVDRTLERNEFRAHFGISDGTVAGLGKQHGCSRLKLHTLIQH